MKIKSFMINIARIWKMMWAFDRWYLVQEILIAIIRSILPIGASAASAYFINRLTTGDLGDTQRLYFFIGLFLMVPVLESLVSVWGQYLSNQIFVRFGQWLDIFLTTKRVSIDIQTYEDKDFNNLAIKAQENKHKILWFIDWIVHLLMVALSFLFSVGTLALYKWWVIPIIIVTLIPELITEIKFGRRKYGIWDAKAEVKRKYYEADRHFRNLPSLIEIKVFRTKKAFQNIIDKLLSNFNSEIISTEKSRSKIKIITTIISYSGIIIILILMIRDVLTSKLLIGTFTFFSARIYSIRTQLNEFFRGFSNLISDNAFITDLFTFIDTEKVLKNGTMDLSEKTPVIKFTNVSFAYPNTEKNILTAINLEVKPGTKVAIVGVNGAGKTTFTKLLMRFYDPTQGTITIGDTLLPNVKIESYYNKIGYLSQDYARYKLPIREAIALGDVSKEIDSDKVIESAKKAGAYEFIMEWEAGFETHLGKEFEGGVEPSVGQWQKLALARLFYRDPQIWILDEPTASIDAVAEMEIFNTLENLPKDRTVFLISHRFNTVKNADIILVIDHGEIKEAGSHIELMKKKGIYADLFTKQKDSFTT